MTADDAVQAALERVSRHRKSLKKHWALSVASGEDVWEERCSHDGQTWPCDAATLAAHIAELEREMAGLRYLVSVKHKVFYDFAKDLQDSGQYELAHTVMNLLLVEQADLDDDTPAAESGS